MIPRRYGPLFLLAALVACGGTTMRVAQDDGSGDAAVALSPTPEPGPDVRTADTVPNPPLPKIDSAATEAGEVKGYAAYGGGNLELRRIGQWTRTGIGESRRLVIRDANAWAEFWSELGVGARPAVDFTRDVVVAVAAGQRPTGGFEIAIAQVRETEGELMVEVVETTPSPNCVSTTALTQPVDIVVVPAVNARGWSFLERKEVRGCR